MLSLPTFCTPKTNVTNAQVTFESALSNVGGTMGLLTGFSILSGVEIIYFLVKFFFECVKEKVTALQREQTEEI